MEQSSSILLICSVGGTPEPVVAAIKHWQPVRIRFVHSPQTKGDIEAKILPKAREEGLELDPGRYDLFELPDAEDLASCVDRLRSLTTDVEEWVKRGEGFRVIVDFTGGTKCMSAALTLQAARWPCVFSYVGGAVRNKGGVGVVVSGAERVLQTFNPWDALGYQAIEDFIVLFDEGAFGAAARVAEEARRRVGQEDRKRELTVLEQLARAFEAWDRFDHGKALQSLKNVQKGANDLRAVLGGRKGDRVLDEIGRLRAHLEELSRASRPTRHHVIDLLANASRRHAERRFDDAVARLYRVIEAIAQVQLAEVHGIESTERVPLQRIPEAMRKTLEVRAEDDRVKLGLQDAYSLLAALGDPLGRKFRDLGLNERESVLTTRNRSVLAHGFDRVSETVSDQMWRYAFELAAAREEELPTFPRMSDEV